ncbi:MAG: hypothetical protein WAM73_07320 [Desulfobacterales bacterium]
MSTDPSNYHPIVTVAAEPGICGFSCKIKAQKSDNRTVTVEITGSECKQIQRLSSSLTEMSLKELFMPLTRNPVYVAAEKSGCHPSCTIPAAVLKAVEVALGMALPMEARIRFENETNAKEDRTTK